MYEAGDAQISWGEGKDDKFADVPIFDSKSDVDLTYPLVFLPHSCDHWVVGGLAEVDLMMGELTALRRKLAEPHG